MKQYNELVRRVLSIKKRAIHESGNKYATKFGEQIRFDHSRGFPLCKHWGASITQAAEDLEKFFQGKGETGYLWRSFGGERPFLNGEDQLKRLIEMIQNEPNSRRLLLTGWDPNYKDEPHAPESILYHFKVVANKTLHCQLFARSANVLKDVPQMIVTAAFFQLLVAHVCDLKLGELVLSFGELYLYDDQRKAAVSLIRKKIRRCLGFGFRNQLLIGFKDPGKAKGFSGLLSFNPEFVWCVGQASSRTNPNKTERYR